jgi:hypothetical protein
MNGENVLRVLVIILFIPAIGAVVASIRDDRISNGGAGRERTKLASAIDRPRERKGTNRTGSDCLEPTSQ